MSHEVGRKQSARQTVFARRAIWLALTSSRALTFELTSHVSRFCLVLSSWFTLTALAPVSSLSFVHRPVGTRRLNHRQFVFSKEVRQCFFLWCAWNWRATSRWRSSGSASSACCVLRLLKVRQYLYFLSVSLRFYVISWDCNCTSRLSEQYHSDVCVTVFSATTAHDSRRHSFQSIYRTVWNLVLKWRAKGGDNSCRKYRVHVERTTKCTKSYDFYAVILRRYYGKK